MLTALAWLIGALVLANIAVAAYFVLRTRHIAAVAEAKVPKAGRTAVVGDERIHYVEEGSGRPILFMHGLGGQLHHFRHPLFKAMGAGYRLVAVDRTGSGYSTRICSGPRIPEQAQLIAGFIDTVGLDRPLLVGHSLGGAIALAVALDRPEKISGVALISPLTHFVSTPPKEFGGLYIKSPLMRRIIAHTIAIPLALRMARQTLDLVFWPQEPPPEYMIEGGGYLGLRPTHFYAVSSDLVAIEQDLPRQESRYGEISVPVGILFGDRDKVLDPEQHGLAMRYKMKGLDLEILEGIGHMPQYTATEHVVGFIHRMAAKSFPA